MERERGILIHYLRWADRVPPKTYRKKTLT